MTSIHSLAAAAILIAASAPAGSLKYPTTARSDQVDVFHDVEVADPYRWLEQDVRASDDVQSWIDAQNAVTKRYLDKIPERSRIRDRLTELWRYEKYRTPVKSAGRYYFEKNDGLQDQYVLYAIDTLDGQPEIVLDPNEWSGDGTVALAGTSFSDDGRWLAYGVADRGSDWRVWRLKDLRTGQDLKDELRWLKFNSPAWTVDGDGFFYSRFPAPDQDAEFQQLNLDQAVYYHRVGTSQEADVLVHRNPEHPRWGFGSKVSEDGRYLILTVWVGTDDRYRILYKDLSEPYGMPIVLIPRFEHEYTFVGNDGRVFYFKTNNDAPNGRLIAIDTRRPAPEHWRELIRETSEPLQSVSLTGNLFVARYLKDAQTRVLMFDVKGAPIREVAFPTLGTASGFGGKRTDTETFYSFRSFTTPPTLYRYDLLTGTSTPFRRADVDFEPAAYEVKQIFYRSKDGTRVPMFVAHKKGITLDGDNPTLLYGYGGFNISLRPEFSLSRLLWMEMGGVFAQANLRGGGEYGEEWHQAGTRTRKQNVFDDFPICSVPACRRSGSWTCCATTDSRPGATGSTTTAPSTTPRSSALYGPTPLCTT